MKSEGGLCRLKSRGARLLHTMKERSIYVFLRIHRFTSRTQQAVQYVLFKTTLTMGFTVISGGFPMLYLQSHVLIPQFISMIMAALQRMYITAWAADDLKEVVSFIRKK
ncbi:PREDICTED: uncharacterized protein LOC105563139 [Vollenhovia emeryi]|uniref:uncharacterized protein LOC105563139 n=1 Tax=Vollenhovia emeryi TaxID=411798 RepID=UPI0005F3715A|nr:PREDICTED: uncharacterized protein LOC105563139 [Vollenhovia emeryi]